jgi:carnitine O-palmitoyltransferase 1, liver isoform
MACLTAAFVYWIVVCLTMRYTLKMLLMYKGWMYESRGPKRKPSFKTTAWAILVKGNL